MWWYDRLRLPNAEQVEDIENLLPWQAGLAEAAISE